MPGGLELQMVLLLTDSLTTGAQLQEVTCFTAEVQAAQHHGDTGAECYCLLLSIVSFKVVLCRCVHECVYLFIYLLLFFPALFVFRQIGFASEG